ncbi:uclacyanin-3-like [Hibiscus syriacus]|uniref:uclacyanin-3-like n=1 Tax=Hibiscus syriacus TaxID=106335 RepID=UPI00192335BA|nr:uclacyanin-3-like [Hibiscus syriacus]
MAVATAFLLLLLLVTPAAYTVQYTVGDNSGWTLGPNYTTWVQGKIFTLGDTLCKLLYTLVHRVDEVTQSGYDRCSSANALHSYSDGNTIITPTRTGSMYFLCSVSGHCTSGMKLAINVVAANVTSSPPSGSTTPSGTPPRGSASSPPLHHSGAAPTTILMLGFSLVLAGVLAIMSLA